ncbi:MAG: DNA methyltransferase [Candidatus Thorarchaeota archaeon]
MTSIPKKTLNDLDAKSWVKSTKSWFVLNPRSRSADQLEHPAKFPEELVERFISFFTKQGTWILDPFAGVGSTLIACRESGRNAVGIELHDEFVESGKKKLSEMKGSGTQYLLIGDSQEAETLIMQQFGDSAPVFDYLITSPPYWDMLRKSRGGNDSVHKQREKQGFKQYYSDSERDLGNIANYDEYVSTVGALLGNLKLLLREKAYLTIVVQNMRDIDGKLKPIAWDLAKRISEDYELRQEMIWCQDNKKLGCWGYPTTYVSNVHHHYCLIFQNCL